MSPISHLSYYIVSRFKSCASHCNWHISINLCASPKSLVGRPSKQFATLSRRVTKQISNLRSREQESTKSEQFRQGHSWSLRLDQYGIIQDLRYIMLVCSWYHSVADSDPPWLIWTKSKRTATFFMKPSLICKHQIEDSIRYMPGDQPNFSLGWDSQVYVLSSSLCAQGWRGHFDPG